MSLLSAATLLVAGCSGQQHDPGKDDASTIGSATVEAIDAAMSQAMLWSGSTEAIVGVWSANGDYVTAYGDSSTGLRGGSQFRGAQTTQPMMCALLLELAQDGTVDLDGKVADDIPRQTGVGDITYRQLCDGTSGLADFKAPFADIFVTNPTRPWPPGELIAQALITPRAPWPGQDVHRSDSEAFLLGQALPVATGEPLEDLLQNRVFRPANMRNTYYPASNELTLRDANGMHGVSYPPGPVCDAGLLDFTEVSPTMLGGAGASVTTATDLKNFYESYLSGTFGNARLSSVITETRPTVNPERDENGTPTTQPESDTLRGFGLLNVGPLWGFSGSMPGASSAAWHDPASGFTVVVALNNSSTGADFASLLGLQLAAVTAESSGGVSVPWAAGDRASELEQRAICQ